MLDNIKLLLNISDTSKDTLLKYLIKSTKNKVLNYLSLKELPFELEDIVVELVVIRYYRMGSEGVQQESFGDVSQTFQADIPEDYKIQLNKFRKLKTL